MGVFFSEGEREGYSWWINSPVCLRKSPFGFVCSLSRKRRESISCLKCWKSSWEGFHFIVLVYFFVFVFCFFKIIYFLWKCCLWSPVNLPVLTCHSSWLTAARCCRLCDSFATAVNWRLWEYHNRGFHWKSKTVLVFFTSKRITLHLVCCWGENLCLVAHSLLLRIHPSYFFLEIRNFSHSSSMYL